MTPGPGAEQAHESGHAIRAPCYAFRAPGGVRVLRGVGELSSAASMLAIDRYGLTIECEGIDASAEQVRARMASVFDRYVTARSL